MKGHVLTIILGCTTVIPGFGQQEHQRAGVINGVVINEMGRPVAGARARVDLMNGPPTTGLIRYVDTDEQGRFTVDRLEWGSYWVVAMKESEGFPDFGNSVYSDGRTFTAKVSAESPTATVLIVIGPKAGTIAGQILDAETGVAVVNPGIRIWRWKEPNKFFSTTLRPQFEMLVPADTEVGLEFDAPGYEVSRYPSDPSFPQGKPLLVKSGEKVSFDIKLQPKSK